MSQTQIETIHSSAKHSIQLTPLPPAKTSPGHDDKEPSPSHLERRLPATTSEASNSPTASLTSQPTPHLRLLSCILAFFTAGLNDGSLGPLTPYFLRHYQIPTSSASWLYLSTFAGWVAVALLGTHVTTYIGLKGALLAGALTQCLAHALRGWGPPWSLYVVSYGVAALGQALQDSNGNTFVASVGERAHRWLGAIHASYGLGLMIGGLASAAVAGGGTEWWPRFFWVALSVGAVNVGLVIWAFFIGKDDVLEESGRDAEGESEGQTRGKNERAMADLKRSAKNKSVWAVSLFYFFHLGVSISAGGWIVEYLVVVRNAPLEKYSYVSTGLSGGLTLGRILLAEPTHRFGERNMLLINTVVVLALQIIFWQVKNVIVNAVMATLMGFFLGPFFAAGVSVATKLLPKSIHSSALSLIFVVAQAGGNFFPAITGIIANKAGVAVLQPLLVGLIVAMGISWALVPKVEKRDE